MAMSINLIGNKSIKIAEYIIQIDTTIITIIICQKINKCNANKWSHMRHVMR